MKSTPSQKFLNEQRILLSPYRLRMADVARKSGVFKSTISRAETGKTSLSHATIAKIENAVERLIVEAEKDE